MKATICAAGGRVHIEPMAGAEFVRLEIITESGGIAASVKLDLSAGGAVLFALENALEVVDVATVRASMTNAERAAVREIFAGDRP